MLPCLVPLGLESLNLIPQGLVLGDLLQEAGVEFAQCHGECTARVGLDEGVQARDLAVHTMQFFGEPV